MCEWVLQVFQLTPPTHLDSPSQTPIVIGVNLLYTGTRRIPINTNIDDPMSKTTASNTTPASMMVVTGSARRDDAIILETA
jgi:hypothetical protein